MFRKAAHILLASLLLITTMGYSLSKHYCGSNLVEVSINFEADPCCNDEGTSDCCKNETEYFQLKVDFVSTVSLDNNQITEIKVLFPLVFTFSICASGNIEIQTSNYAESPPPKIQTKLSLLQTYLC